MQRYDTDRGEPAVKIPEQTSRGLSRSQTPYEVSNEALRSDDPLPRLRLRRLRTGLIGVMCDPYLQLRNATHTCKKWIAP